jgi:Spy/CpxP family protein refolding chaperone
MQWDMQSEQEKLVLLLKAHPIDENAVLTQVDKVLDREREIKKTQILLLIRIKNQLTPAQQNKLNELRHKSS